MISCLKKALCFVILIVGSTSFAAAQTKFFEVASTPYDRQMSRIQETFAAPSIYPIQGLSFSLINEWMIELRAMPYRYSHEWRTPAEVEAARAADCKGKAVALYDRMLLNGATNVRLVIGKRRASDSLTHAWLEWDTEFGPILLDPTFNWTAATKIRDVHTYIPFYGYEGGHKYQAATSLWASRTITTRSPASPAHGVITRPTRPSSQMHPISPLFDEGPIAPSFFSYRSGF